MNIFFKLKIIEIMIVKITFALILSCYLNDSVKADTDIDFYSYLQNNVLNSIDITSQPDHQVTVAVELFFTEIYGSKTSNSDNTLLGSVYITQKWKDLRHRWNNKNNSDFKLAHIISDKIWM